MNFLVGTGISDSIRSCSEIVQVYVWLKKSKIIPVRNEKRE